MKLQKTPLHQICVQQGCRMVEFAGWEMPIQFSGLINEHESVRNNAGIFDISHMGTFSITGVNAKDSIQKLVPSDLHRIGPGESCYTVLLNKNGGIIDDLIIYDLGIDKENNDCLIVIVNAACKHSDLEWFKQNLNKEVNISNSIDKKVLLAIQGPNSEKYLNKYFKNCLSNLPRFGHCTIDPKNHTLKSNKSIFVSRTGYTGEDGFEILLDELEAKELWINLINEGIKPCGLGARDTLRLEAGMLLYGNDMNSNTTPFNAKLGWLVNLEMQGDFIGREALEKQVAQGIEEKLVGLEIKGKGIARKGYEIFNGMNKVGEITSGSWSPTLKQAIALAYLPEEFTKAGTVLDIKIRNKMHEASVVKLPFYRRVS